VQSNQVFAAARRKKAEVADLDETFWENVLQEAVDEFFGCEGAELKLAGIGRPITEGDLTILQFHQAAVANGNPKDIGSQIFERSPTIAYWLAMNNPILLPNLRRYLSKVIRLL
jgi:hypothetical protein